MDPPPCSFKLASSAVLVFASTDCALLLDDLQSCLVYAERSMCIHGTLVNASLNITAVSWVPMCMLPCQRCSIEYEAKTKHLRALFTDRKVILPANTNFACHNQCHCAVAAREKRCAVA